MHHHFKDRQIEGKFLIYLNNKHTFSECFSIVSAFETWDYLDGSDAEQNGMVYKRLF